MTYLQTHQSFNQRPRSRRTQTWTQMKKAMSKMTTTPSLTQTILKTSTLTVLILNGQRLDKIQIHKIPHPFTNLHKARQKVCQAQPKGLGQNHHLADHQQAMNIQSLCLRTHLESLLGICVLHQQHSKHSPHSRTSNRL